jgi:hypothetical protein
MRGWVAGAWLFFVVGCGPDAATDAGPREDASGCAAGCDDGLYCNGVEVCDTARGICNAGTMPCPGGCDETSDVCDCGQADFDGDGADAIACGGDDCDDADPSRRPGLPESCDTEHVDEDCNPNTFGERDGDRDTYFDARCCNGATCGDDCNDAIATVHPGEADSCDGLDNDCDDNVDESPSVVYYRDADGDLHGAMGDPGMRMCAPSGEHTALTAGDCDDTNPELHPAANGTCAACPAFRRAEQCDGLDDDCDGFIDGAAAACAPIANGTASCMSGSCMITSCDTGYHLCGDACASNGSVDTCGTRCSPCPLAANAASATCDGANCGLACVDGHVELAGACEVAPPRPIAPLSTSSVTSRRPTLRWELVQGSDGAQVELCEDRACGTILFTIDAAGTSAAPPTDLAPGVVFWRLRSRTGSAVSAAIGPTWQFHVGTRSAPTDTSWGTTLDVNGDGYADAAVGASGVESNLGKVYVYLGGPAGLASAPSTTLDGTDASGQFGFSVASAGDVDGDGYPELVVGAPLANSTGRVYVFFGGPSGLVTSPVRLSGTAAGSNFGRSVAGAGDVDGDGYADVIVGARQEDAGVSGGRAHVYRGGPSGLSSTPSLLSVPAASSLFGGSVASAGDVDADGYGDVVVGASGAHRAYVFSGSATGVETMPSATLAVPETDLSSFGASVAGLGDLDADGYCDVGVGAPNYEDGRDASTGRVYVYLGDAAGLTTTASQTLTGPDGAGGRFGIALAGAGDADGDGDAELVVGADLVGSSAGRAYVYRGVASGSSTTASPVLTNADATTARFGASVAGAGDLDADGFADLWVGAPGLGAVPGRAHAFFGGSGGTGTTPALSRTGPGGTGGLFGVCVSGSAP